MKIQIRNGVFETNSSSTHSLSIYPKSDWKKFKSDEMLMDSYNDKLIVKSDIEEKYRNSNDYKEFLEKNNYDDTEENMTEYIYQVGDYYDYDSYNEEYDIEEKEVPDSNYIAVSIYREDY